MPPALTAFAWLTVPPSVPTSVIKPALYLKAWLAPPARVEKPTTTPASLMPDALATLPPSVPSDTAVYDCALARGAAAPRTRAAARMAGMRHALSDVGYTVCGCRPLTVTGRRWE